MYSASARGRRDRTFVGGECAACEEALELTLHGERIIQLTCGHISHEACFYEYIREFEVQTCPSCDAPLSLDTSRGGASIDFQNLNRLVRSLQESNDRDDRPRKRSPISLPRAVEFSRRCSRTHASGRNVSQREYLLPRQKAFACNQTEPAPRQNESVEIDTSLPAMYTAADPIGDRYHGYDAQATEVTVTSLRPTIRNSVPPPAVTLRSEFPAITKSRQQQSLTCLVTVEVTNSRQSQPFHEQTSRSPSTPESLTSKLGLPRSPLLKSASPVDSVHEGQSALSRVKDELLQRMDHWHGMEYAKFGTLLIHGRLRVSKDGRSWQDLDCYLFTNMLICVKERKLVSHANREWDDSSTPSSKSRYVLKGSILVQKHLKRVDASPEYATLTLNLTVVELPTFHLKFFTREQFGTWHETLDEICQSRVTAGYETRGAQMLTSAKQEDIILSENPYGNSPETFKDMNLPTSESYRSGRSQSTVPMEFPNILKGAVHPPLQPLSLHIPLDLVVVVPSSSSMQGLKVNALRNALRFLISNLGERDRMGLVTFGSGNDIVPFVGMTSRTWSGWTESLDSIGSTAQQRVRAGVLDGANTAIDMLVKRKSPNPLATILLISDMPKVDHESANSIVVRAEAAKIPIYSFGLGLLHKPDTLVEISTRTKASYTYVKDWMMLRDCLAGCLGALQSSSHQNVKLKLRLPSGSPAKFVRVSGGLSATKRVTGRNIEVELGDLRFGDKRDVLVQLVIPSNTFSFDLAQIDPWSNVVAGLEALGGIQGHNEPLSAEETPLIQADLIWGDLQGGGNLAKLPQPSLLAVAVLSPDPTKSGSTVRSLIAGISHPTIVQRRMELLSSDMLTRALSLVSHGKHDRAKHLLTETRSILKGLAKGSLPPLPPPPSAALPATPPSADHIESSAYETTPISVLQPNPSRASSTFRLSAAPGIDVKTMLALDRQLGASLEWIEEPTVFMRDARKNILQAIGTISTQRAFTFRTPVERLWASRIAGVQRLAALSEEWAEIDDADTALAEET
nr:hypothetical protein CFP56_53380 [Quercus suber]